MRRRALLRALAVLGPASAAGLPSLDELRPRDLTLEADPNGNAVIEWGRYEGETRLYSIRLPDGGAL